MNRCASRDTLRRRIDGDLPEPERPALDRHVETCPRCQAELGLLSDGPLPPEVAAELRRTPVGGRRRCRNPPSRTSNCSR